MNHSSRHEGSTPDECNLQDQLTQILQHIADLNTQLQQLREQIVQVQKGIDSASLPYPAQQQPNSPSLVHEPFAAKARHSQALLSLAIDLNPSVVFIRDNLSRFVLANRALSKLCGISTDEIRGRTPLDLADKLGLDRAQAEGHMRHDEQVRSSHMGQEWTDLIVDPQGHERWFRTVLVPMESKRFHDHVLGVCTEITQQRITEEALRQSEREYRHLVESAPVGILSVDVEGTLTEANAALLEMPGFGALLTTREQPLNVLLDPTMVQTGMAEDIGNCLHSGQAREIERHYMLGGRDVELRYRVQPIRNESDEITGALALVEDISERKRLERQLYQAAKMEAIGRLAGGIAHDFNNLLTVINGYSDVRLAQLSPQDPSYEDLQHIRHAGHRAADLTQRLLAFSRREEHDSNAQTNRLDLNELLIGMAKILQRILGEEIELDLNLNEDTPPIYADAGQIEQIIINLAINARDAIFETLAVGERPGIALGSANGSLVISTDVRKLGADEMPPYLDAEPGTYAMISVRDTGTGMDADTCNHLFEPFFTTKEAGKGTGLGLAIVYSVLQGLGGTVDVQTEPGVGTTFHLFFPILKEHDTIHHEGELLAQAPRGSGRILVVEDQDYVRELTTRMLRDLGYTVEMAANGTEALALCASGLAVDLVITDVVMPGMSGPALVSALRAELPDVPVVYVSGYTQEMIQDRGGLDPDIRMISKPFSIEHLAQAVHEALAEHHSSRA
jgi:two-component system, cell cycle sensor histidine kinase and response regulator CckA